MDEIDIFKILVQAEEKKKRAQPLVNSFEVKEILPCFTTPGYIRFVAQADHELGEVIPIIFLRYPPGKTTYTGKENTLTLRLFNRMITLFPSGKIGVTNTKDVNEAHEVLQKIKEIINEAYSEYIKFGKPNPGDIEAARKISWIDLYNCLPQTNCGECGYQTCSALALSVLQGEAKLSQCTPMREPKYLMNLEKLRKTLGPFLLRALCWKEVP